MNWKNLMANNAFFISAGDLSGEIHATYLVKEIKNLSTNTKIVSVGGHHLQSVSDIFLDDIVNINAFGFFPIKSIFYLRKVLAKIKQNFLKNPPDKIILVDYYGFNILIAKLAKKFLIPVYYYISPQVWASRKGRIKTLKEYIKKIFVILPFEEKLYRENDVEVQFVGHPLIDRVFQKKSFEISNPPLIGLFPGSRQSIIKKHIPILIETAKILKKEIKANFIMFSTSKTVSLNLPDFIEVDCSADLQKREKINFAICPSGTVSLENALMGIPMAVFYKISYFNYLLIKAIAKVKYITMVNILSAKKIVPEFIQNDADPKKIAKFAIEQLESKNYNFKIQELLELRKMLGQNNVAKRVAEGILASL
ncbi:MAG: lipid-A-disaccharide synthase [Elusimicrobiota bacterium]|nr:lipid-A-disaccharide synthase [Elusimicrobiota bacterium]